MELASLPWHAVTVATTQPHRRHRQQWRWMNEQGNGCLLGCWMVPCSAHAQWRDGDGQKSGETRCHAWKLPISMLAHTNTRQAATTQPHPHPTRTPTPIFSCRAVPRPPHPTPTSRAHTPARPTPADAENGNPPGGGGQHPRKAWPPLHHAPCPPAGGLPCPPTQALRFTFSADAEFSSF